MAYEDSFSFGTDIEAVFLDDGYTAPSSSSSSGISGLGMLQVGASILKSIGGYMQGMAGAKVDEFNAQLALIQGQFAEEQIGKEEGLVLSTQKAMFAKAGVEQTGSPLDTALQTATNYEYDKQIAQYNAKSKAAMLNWEAQQEKSKAKFSLGMGLLEGVGSMALMLA